MPEPHQTPLRRRLSQGNVSLVLSALALLVACTGITPAEAAQAVKRALNADKVNGIAASKTPTPGKLVPLGADGKFPASVVPQIVGPRGPRGSEGPAGPAGGPGAAGAGGSAGSGSVPTVADANLFRARTLFEQPIPAKTDRTVVFGGEDLDSANAFDQGSGEFIAPVSGVYAFDASLTLNDRAETTRSVVRIVAPEAGQVLRGTDVTSSGFQSMQVSGLIKLAKGQRALVLMWSEIARNVIQDSGQNVFSGLLVARL